MTQQLNLKVPSHWNVVSLEEICGKGSYGSGASAIDFDEVKPRYIRITDINDNGQLNNSKVSPSTDPEDWAKNSCEDGDLLFARSGATVGKTFLYDSSYGHCVYAGYLIRFRPNQKIVLPRYLFHFTKTPVYDSWVLAQQKTVAQPNINAKQYGSDLPIPLPPLGEQQRIAAILDKADALRAKRRAALAKLNTLLQATFLDMFGDPITNPMGWPTLSLDEAADSLTGFAFKSQDYQDHAEQAIRLCRGINVSPGTTNWTDCKYWKSTNLNGLERFMLREGDIVIAMDRPWISTGLKVTTLLPSDVPALLVQRVNRLRANPPFNNAFIYQSILHPAFTIHCNPTETTVPHISPKDISSYPILMPKGHLLIEFEKRVKATLAMKGRLQKFEFQLNSLFNSLQQHAFKGEL